MVNRIESAITKVENLMVRKMVGEIEKMQNIQNKYVLEKNQSVIFHDPETGLPKLVIIISMNF